MTFPLFVPVISCHRSRDDDDDGDDDDDYYYYYYWLTG